MAVSREGPVASFMHLCGLCGVRTNASISPQNFPVSGVCVGVGEGEQGVFFVNGFGGELLFVSWRVLFPGAAISVVVVGMLCRNSIY